MNGEGPRVIGARLSQREARLGRVFWIMLAIVTCLAALLGVESVCHEAAERSGYDFYQFWLGGDVLRARQAAGRHEVLDVYTYASHVEIGQHGLREYEDKLKRDTLPAGPPLHPGHALE